MSRDLIFINSVNGLDEYSNEILSSSINIALCQRTQHKLNRMKDNLLELNEFLASTDNLYDYIYTEDVKYRLVNKVTDYYEK